jgi:hypothetical protein
VVERDRLPFPGPRKTCRAVDWNVPRRQGQLSGVSALAAGIGPVVLRRAYSRRVMATCISWELCYTLGLRASPRGRDAMEGRSSWRKALGARGQALPSVKVSTAVQIANLAGVEGKGGGHPEGVPAVSRPCHSLSDQDHVEVKQSIIDTSIAVSVVAAPSALLITAAIAQVPDAVLSSEQSKMCHPQEYDVWAATAHPNSVGAVQASDHGSDSCLHCMSTDHRYNRTITVV